MSLIRTTSITMLVLLFSVSLITAGQDDSGEISNRENREETLSLEKLPFAEDLMQEARAAACKGQPLVLMFGSSTCPYCKVVRSLYLAPLERDGRYPGIIVRELETDSAAKVRDFSGTMTTMEELSNRYRVTLVPVVMVFTPGGIQAGKTLLGLSTEDFYGAYLDQAIQEGGDAISAMTSGVPNGGPGGYVCD